MSATAPPTPAEQKQMEAVAEEYKGLSESLQKNGQARAGLSTQLMENEAVLKELSVLEADAVLFKLVGPVLVKESPDDARVNVEKRLTYIREELDRSEKVAKTLQTQLEETQQKVERIQRQVQARRAGQAAP